MLHIATVHWRKEDWIDIQLRYLKKHLSTPFRVYAFLNEIPESHQGKFFYTSTEPIREHAVKLNMLADIIRFSSRDDHDLLMFLDGDAFPIHEILPVLVEKLASSPLVAVQRLENNGDKQPHPCFCVTTVGFWKSIGGDWKEGYAWNDAAGKPVTDVGGNLLGILERRNIRWCPLNRSNLKNLHPLWFGIYGGIIYHHGAGFRPDKYSRADLTSLAAAKAHWSPVRKNVARMLERLLSKNPIRALRTKTSLQRAIERNWRLSDELFEQIKSDEHFYRALTE
jgi:hypothetical protein